MVHIFEGKSFAEVYPKLLEAILKNGKYAGARGMKTLEVTGAAIELSSTQQKFISYAGRDMNPVFPIVETMWYLSGTDKPDMVIHYASKMADYINPFTGRFDGAYGKRWRRWAGTFDQVGAVLNALRRDQYTRRAVMTTFNPLMDVNQSSLDIPCNITFQFVLRYEHLDMFVYCRSEDAWYGLPNDLCEWQLLQNIFAGWVQATPGKLVHFIGSLHLYDTEVDKAVALLKSKDDDMYAKGFIAHKMNIDEKAFADVAKTFYRLERLSRTGEDFKLMDAVHIENLFWKDACLAILVYNARKYDKLTIAKTAFQAMSQNSDVSALITNWLARRGEEEIIHR